MKYRAVNYGIAATAMIAVSVLLLVSMPAAQNKAPAAKPAATGAKATPRTADGHPDFSGFYSG